MGCSARLKTSFELNPVTEDKPETFPFLSFPELTPRVTNKNFNSPELTPSVANEKFNPPELTHTVTNRKYDLQELILRHKQVTYQNFCVVTNDIYDLPEPPSAC